MLKRTLTTLALISSLTLSAHAEDNRWDYFKNVTVVNLSAEARTTVTQDRLKATLTIEHEAKTAEAVQAQINNKMQAALKAAGNVKNVKAQTGRYNVRKQSPYDRNLTLEQRERRTTWKGSQTLILDSGNKEDILKLAGGIQSMGFAITSLNYYLSREKGDSYKDELTTDAVENVKQRAAKLAKQLGLPKVHFANINFGHTMPTPIRHYGAEKMLMARSMSADAVMPEPVAAEGDSDIVVNVNVEVHLSR